MQVLQKQDNIHPFGRSAFDKKQEVQRIPLYSMEAVAGLIPLFKEASTMIPESYIEIPNAPKCDGAIYVTGDSMYPRLKSGDIIIYKEINDIINSIFFGEMCLLSINVDDEKYITVKYIQKSEQEGCAKLVSQNTNHQERDIPINRIRALAFVKASIRFNHMR